MRPSPAGVSRRVGRAVSFGPRTVTILVATRNRPGHLEATLQSIERCVFPARRRSVLVTDNGGDEATRAVCESAATGMDLSYLRATEGGKNAALNRAVERAEGALLLFTDDDVDVDPGWISTMWEGARRWPDHEVFGGRVLPRWPTSPPVRVLEAGYGSVAYSILDPDLPEGPDPGFLPFGPNCAVRREVFDRGVRFDPAMGPRPGAYVMGGETELFERLRAAGKPPVFLPDSRVHHRIRRCQYSRRWLLSRARKYGRSLVARSERAGSGGIAGGGDGVPRWLYRTLLESGARALVDAVAGRRVGALKRAMDAAVELGKIDYLDGRTAAADHAD